MNVRILKNLINGVWSEPSAGARMDIHNPSTGEVIADAPASSKEDIDLAVSAARHAFSAGDWPLVKPYERGQMLLRVAEMIRENKESLALLETLDTGKPISQGRADVEAAARYFEFYGGAADKIHGETIPIEPGVLDYTLREPVGVTAHIIPWNYPLQVASRSCAAALATGNTVVMKPAEQTPLTAVELGMILQQAGVPDGVVNLVLGEGHTAGARLAGHPDVNHITFTGSVPTGTEVMKAAAENIVPVTLELGGKSPNIVFPDASQDEAVEWVVKSIIQNAGQTCSAGSRLLVHADCKASFVEKVIHRMNHLSMGPGESDPDIGPILSEQQCRRIETFMKKVEADGGKFLLGGTRAYVSNAPGGCYFKPTVIDGLRPESEIAREEVFGPVLSVFAFETDEEAADLANSTEYGLVTGIWTKDVSRAHKLAEKVKAGQIFINNYGAGGGIQMPFGGYGKSGFGREKGLEALRNYTQLKNIALKI
ncbi:aldehyde dehydrogenase family protein [Halobacillus kuroshimensis]|uniref:Aldehyde dehydrogenase family protein n=1 Tax=Halobacillus kuroshimensis TaxID=302481 RepID=A0ABS3DR55_9BACI|nr:aldehyde dehydrogenase family protein [Halobacillus kuroshimensis]MBN8233823.1 aldehyde dehydrogenase family protein [Halobacillus kuroshimensis]